ncbi:MAG: hypothetical protein ABC585_03585 [Candidatus Methanosuratincola petrocarbonis]
MSPTAKVLAGVVALALCFVAVPLIAATIGGWYAYWGAILLSCAWAAVLLWLRVTEFWEGD